MSLKTLFAAGFVLVAATCLAAAQSAEEAQKSCAEDVVKTCAKSAGKADELKACLVTNLEKLAPACKKAIEATRS